MSGKTETSKREALAGELADILYRQKVLVNCNAVLGGDVPPVDRDTFHHMFAADEKNLRLLESVISSFGVVAEPSEVTRRLGALATDVIAGEDGEALAKLELYASLKQTQATCGEVVHRSAQIADPDVREALASFHLVQAELSKQATRATALIERRGVELIMGEEPMTGVFAKARDGAAMAINALLGQGCKPLSELSILTVLRLDHHKIATLFQEINASGEPAEVQGLFRQLQGDLTAHTEAEERTFYAAFEPLPDLNRRLVDARHDHEEMRILMASVSARPAGSDEFTALCSELQSLVDLHVEEEEGELFKLIETKVGQAELVRLSGEFLRVKREVQLRLGFNHAEDAPLATGRSVLD